MFSAEVLNFGSLNIDHVYRVPHFVAPGETLSCLNYSVFAGGTGLNQSIALARAGVKTAHAGKIGHDGGFLIETLKEAGVDTQFVLEGETPTGHASIQVDSAGQNSILLYPGSNCDISETEILSVLEQQIPGTWLMLQNEINSIPFLMREAHKRGLRIAINPAPCTDAVKDYPLELAELLFVNEIEAAQLSGSSGSFDEIADRLVKQYPSLKIVMTLGGAGAIYRCGKEFHFEPAMSSEVVDTTSAGDTFCGYFLSSLMKGFSAAETMKFAAKASSVTVSRPGAAVSIPLAEEIF